MARTRRDEAEASGNSSPGGRLVRPSREGAGQIVPTPVGQSCRPTRATTQISYIHRSAAAGHGSHENGVDSWPATIGQSTRRKDERLGKEKDRYTLAYDVPKSSMSRSIKPIELHSQNVSPFGKRRANPSKFADQDELSSTDDSDDDLPSLEELIGNHLDKVGKERSSKIALSNSLSNLRLKPDLNQANLNRNLRNAPASLSPSSSDTESPLAILRYSPPRSPTRLLNRKKDERPVTPPSFIPKSKLLATPNRSTKSIPKPDLRESLDAFWSPNTINTWNDQHSPQKVLKSPKKRNPLLFSADKSPDASQTKLESPKKRTKADVALRKDFAARKHEIAENFLNELDNIVACGQIQRLAASTDGVRIVWSKSLSSTAGRANWRRESIKIAAADGTIQTIQRHHAHIELAEKVIDNEERLLNVLAHEFCHLCNFMISGIKDQPHGAQFKSWGRKCTLAFGDRGIKVTTKHNYEIEYKYIWQCTNEDCGQDFKRHSKSIDPKRHTCGRCRAKLEQIKPVPRGIDASGKINSYTAFVKANFATVRAEMPGRSQKEVMEAVARRYRAEKSRAIVEAVGVVPDNAESISTLDEIGSSEVEQATRMLETVSLTTR